jgi:hypothetical protein
LANNIVVVFHLAARVGFWAAIFLRACGGRAAVPIGPTGSGEQVSCAGITRDYWVVRSSRTTTAD